MKSCILCDAPLFDMTISTKDVRVANITMCPKNAPHNRRAGVPSNPGCEAQSRYQRFCSTIVRAAFNYLYQISDDANIHENLEEKRYSVWISNPPKGSNFRARKIQKFRETHGSILPLSVGKKVRLYYEYSYCTVSLGLAVSLVAIANNYELRRPPQFLDVYLKASLPIVS
jgi:hypothetical protein